MADQTWKLYVYDKSSDIDRDQADGRFDDEMFLFTLPIEKGWTQLIDELGNLVTKGWTFDRALFQTHGYPGGIMFGKDPVGVLTVRKYFPAFAPLFPYPSKIYFDGCNVAEGGDGTDFLIDVGATLLTKSGGVTIGWTTLGHGVPGWVPFIGGHSLHFGDLDGDGTLKAIMFNPGGVPDFPDSIIPSG